MLHTILRHGDGDTRALGWKPARSSRIAGISHILPTRHASCELGAHESQARMNNADKGPCGIDCFNARSIFPATTRQPLSWASIGHL